MHSRSFTTFANRAASLTGRPITFAIAAGAVVLWAILGPLFHFSDGWQLTINTGTTIITFLMVFLIQNTQNRDTAAIQTKLDELIRATDGANNALLDLEQLDDKAISKIREPYEELARQEREAIHDGGSGRGTGPVPSP